MIRRLSRREMLGTLGVGAVGLLAAACGPGAPTAATPAVGGATAAQGQSATSAPAPAATSAPAAQAPTTGAPTPVSLTWSEVIGTQIPIWYALDKGVFTDNGLKVDDQFIASSPGVAAMISGQIQVASAAGSAILNAVASGADLVVVAELSPVYPYVFEAAPDLKTPDDLRGKKVGVSNIGSASYLATTVALKKIGLDPQKDVTIIAVGSLDNRVAAMISGAIQGGVAQPPDTKKVEDKGFHPLFDLAELKLPTTINTIAMQRSYLNANRATVQRLVDSLVQATALAKKDKEGTVAVLKKYFKTDDTEAMGVTYDYFMQHVAPSLPYPAPEQYADAVEQLTAANARVQDVNLKGFLDDSLVKSAADRGLDKA